MARDQVLQVVSGQGRGPGEQRPTEVQLYIQVGEAQRQAEAS